MTPKDKELLIKDLSARLSYGIIAHYILFDKYPLIGSVYMWSDSGFYIRKTDKYSDNWTWKYETWTSCEFDTFKPYLRPMSSMTKEELNELENVASLSLYDNEDGEVLNGKTITNGADIDWLNAHHFDYRNLIEKGLALEAPEDMYKTK